MSKELTQQQKQQIEEYCDRYITMICLKSTNANIVDNLMIAYKDLFLKVLELSALYGKEIDQIIGEHKFRQFYDEQNPKENNTEESNKIAEEKIVIVNGKKIKKRKSQKEYQHNYYLRVTKLKRKAQKGI